MYQRREARPGRVQFESFDLEESSNPIRRENSSRGYYPIEGNRDSSWGCYKNDFNNDQFPNHWRERRQCNDYLHPATYKGKQSFPLQNEDVYDNVCLDRKLLYLGGDVSNATGISSTTKREERSLEHFRTPGCSKEDASYETSSGGSVKLRNKDVQWASKPFFLISTENPNAPVSRSVDPNTFTNRCNLNESNENFHERPDRFHTEGNIQPYHYKGTQSAKFLDINSDNPISYAGPQFSPYISSSRQRHESQNPIHFSRHQDDSQRGFRTSLLPSAAQVETLGNNLFEKGRNEDMQINRNSYLRRMDDQDFQLISRHDYGHQNFLYRRDGTIKEKLPHVESGCEFSSREDDFYQHRSQYNLLKNDSHQMESYGMYCRRSNLERVREIDVMQRNFGYRLNEGIRDRMESTSCYQFTDTAKYYPKELPSRIYHLEENSTTNNMLDVLPKTYEDRYGATCLEMQKQGNANSCIASMTGKGAKAGPSVEKIVAQPPIGLKEIPDKKRTKKKKIKNKIRKLTSLKLSDNPFPKDMAQRLEHLNIFRNSAKKCIASVYPNFAVDTLTFEWAGRFIEVISYDRTVSKWLRDNMNKLPDLWPNAYLEPVKMKCFVAPEQLDSKQQAEKT